MGMDERAVAVVGLPGSGKTTFLAALWHVVVERDVETRLRLGTLRTGGQKAYLNEIAERWRKAVKPPRTIHTGAREVVMDLVDGRGASFGVTFPDLPGESFSRMWENRVCQEGLAATLDRGHVLLLVNADTVTFPHWVLDEADFNRRSDADPPTRPATELAWEPKASPTQVQLLDLLQMLRTPPLDKGPRRLAVVFNAWDTVAAGLSPTNYLAKNLTMLEQYLSCGADGWVLKTWGVSAQGGEYDDPDKPATAAVSDLRKREASRRIDVTDDGVNHTHDITDPIAWLVERGCG